MRPRPSSCSCPLHRFGRHPPCRAQRVGTHSEVCGEFISYRTLRGRRHNPHPLRAPGVAVGLGAPAAPALHPAGSTAALSRGTGSIHPCNARTNRRAQRNTRTDRGAAWGGGVLSRCGGAARAGGALSTLRTAFAAVRVGNSQPERGKGDFSPSRLSSWSLFPPHQLPSLSCSFRSAAFCALLGH